MIQLNKSDSFFKAVKFVISAADTDKVRQNFYQRLHVEKEEGGDRIAAATDGKRLHIFKLNPKMLPELIAGDYNVFSKAAQIMLEKHDFDVSFLNWKAVVPSDELMIKAAVLQPNHFKSGEAHFFISSLGILMNIDYLKPLKELEGTWEFYA